MSKKEKKKKQKLLQGYRHFIYVCMCKLNYKDERTLNDLGYKQYHKLIMDLHTHTSL